jgi:biopolymer transport protein ExbD
MNFRSELAGEQERFQLAPLIDIVFLLLVFFVVTSALQQFEREMSIQVPTAEKGKPPKRTSPPYYVNIRRDGTLIVSNRTYTLDELRTWLKSLGEAYGASPPTIVIRADRNTPSQHLVSVIDACIGAGIGNFAIANIKEPPRAP